MSLLSADQHSGRLETAVQAAGFDSVLTVPCSILRQWYTPADTLATLYLSREEEGVGLAAGLIAAGRQPLLMIQNSGLGNCVNALGSLAVAYRIPMVIVVSLRGDELDDNPVQLPMGEATVALIQALGCSWTRINAVGELTAVLMAARHRAVDAGRPEFVLLPRRELLC